MLGILPNSRVFHLLRPHKLQTPAVPSVKNAEQPRWQAYSQTARCLVSSMPPQRVASGCSVYQMRRTTKVVGKLLTAGCPFFCGRAHPSTAGKPAVLLSSHQDARRPNHQLQEVPPSRDGRDIRRANMNKSRGETRTLADSAELKNGPQP